MRKQPPPSPKRLHAVAPRNGKTARSRFMCACGTEFEANDVNVRNGNTRSCGCYRSMRLKLSGKPRNTHGMCKTGTYRTWANMLSRCYDFKSKAYKWYGARGIEVCERWFEFEAFYADMGLCPKGLTIERKNNNGNYEPDNCHWVSRKIQGNNRRDNQLFNYEGCMLTIPQIIERSKSNINPMNVANRVLRLGWSMSDALTRSVAYRSPRSRQKSIGVIEKDHHA